MEGPPKEPLHNSSWEIFVLALSVLSLFNIVLVALVLQDDDAVRVVLAVDGALCIVFFADFLYRLFRASSKRAYFVREGGWLDFIGSLPIPALRIARGLRVARAIVAIRNHGGRRIWRDFVRERAQGAMYLVLLLVVLVLEFASIGVLAAERHDSEANIATASDALWWGYVTITTVGYGDRFPVTDAGRVVGVVLLTIGVGLFGTFTAFIANVFLAPKKRRVAPEAAGTVAELRVLLDEHERTTELLRAKLAELDDGASATQLAPP